MNSDHNRQNCTGSVIASRHLKSQTVLHVLTKLQLPKLYVGGTGNWRQWTVESGSHVYYNTNARNKQIFRTHATAKLRLLEDTVSTQRSEMWTITALKTRNFLCCNKLEAMEIILQQLALLFHFQHLWDRTPDWWPDISTIYAAFLRSVCWNVLHTLSWHTHTRFVITTLLPTRHHLHDRQNTRHNIAKWKPPT
jgi:hypothetical protein